MNRIDPPETGNERDTLLGFLAYQRETFLGKCEGLTPAQLVTRSQPPSGLCLLGLMRHLAEVERSWLRRRLGNDVELPFAYSTDADPDADFNVPGPDADGLPELADEARATWSAEVAAGNAVLAGVTDLGQVFRSRSGAELSVRWLLAHLIEEYARHNGHADLLREAIDGVTGE